MDLLVRYPLPTAPTTSCAHIRVLLEDAATASLAFGCFLPLRYILSSASALLLSWWKQITSSSGSKIQALVYGTGSLWQGKKALKNTRLPYSSCKWILHEYGSSRYPLCRKTKSSNVNKSDLFRYLSRSAVFNLWMNRSWGAVNHFQGVYGR